MVETILAQCNPFLVLRLVNPRDLNYVRTVMENLQEADARMLPGFGPGQGIVSGQAVRFPLLVKVQMDEDLMHSALGDEDFIKQASEWQPPRHMASRAATAKAAEKLSEMPSRRAGERRTEGGDGESTSISSSDDGALQRANSVVDSWSKDWLSRDGAPDRKAAARDVVERLEQNVGGVSHSLRVRIGKILGRRNRATWNRHIRELLERDFG